MASTMISFRDGLPVHELLQCSLSSPLQPPLAFIFLLYHAPSLVHEVSFVLLPALRLYT